MSMSLELGSTELDPALQMCLTRAELREMITSLGWQHSVMQARRLLAFEGSLLACVQFGGHLDPLGFFLQICFLTLVRKVGLNQHWCIAYSSPGAGLKLPFSELH